MLKNEKIRNVIFILLGVLLLLIKPHYNGPFLDIIKSYLGNISISFSVYFIISFYSRHWKMNKLITALIALLIVQLFEVLNGFGVMTNVYDNLDLLANLLGILVALSIDLMIKNVFLKSRV
ncbi:MAG: hypothetical protein IPI19_03585 [Ignavibacteriales bacterium]|nr:hypothetical protein [Ignavibacteriales bacterium]